MLVFGQVHEQRADMIFYFSTHPEEKRLGYNF